MADAKGRRAPQHRKGLFGVVEIRAVSPRTPLHAACEGGHTGVVERLLGARADVHRTSTDGSAALHVASRFGHFAAVRRLLGAGARVTRGDSRGCTPLWLAASEGTVAVVRALLGYTPTPKP